MIFDENYIKIQDFGIPSDMASLVTHLSGVSRLTNRTVISKILFEAHSGQLCARFITMCLKLTHLLLFFYFTHFNHP